MIYSPRAQAQGQSITYIHKVPTSNRFIFHMGELTEVSEHVFIHCFEVEASVP